MAHMRAGRFLGGVCVASFLPAVRLLFFLKKWREKSTNKNASPMDLLAGTEGAAALLLLCCCCCWYCCCLLHRCAPLLLPLEALASTPRVPSARCLALVSHRAFALRSTFITSYLTDHLHLRVRHQTCPGLVARVGAPTAQEPIADRPSP
jgi:hypothetical protein